MPSMAEGRPPAGGGCRSSQAAELRCLQPNAPQPLLSYQGESKASSGTPALRVSSAKGNPGSVLPQKEREGMKGDRRPGGVKRLSSSQASRELLTMAPGWQVEGE